MEKLYQLEKPDLSQLNLPKILPKFMENNGNIAELMAQTSQPQYLYWTKVKHKKICPFLTREELWALIKFFRASLSTQTVVRAENGVNFFWHKFAGYEEHVHTLDLHTGGLLTSNRHEIDRVEKNKYISKGIMEEAIASSQLEGANTTRKVAKEFLREGRQPKNESEQMVLNTYRTMVEIEDDFKNREFDLPLLFELHSRITEKTLVTKEQGRLRQDSDEIVVTDRIGTIYHVAPRIAFVEKELERLILFANDQLTEEFNHPIIKAIILHFWVGYLHPFTDGNGRVARSLFYWYLLKHGYWAISYLPISKRIRLSSAQYKKAFIHTEQDDFDLTYFIHYNLRKMLLAKDDFQAYVDDTLSRNQSLNLKASTTLRLNQRQIDLLYYFHNQRNQQTNASIHANTHQVSRVTAHTDLKELEALELLLTIRRGRGLVYVPSQKMHGLFE